MEKKIDLAFVVDDDRIYVYGLTKMMHLHNICKNLLVFNNGEEAIKYITPVINLNEELPDVILLDLNMPVLDGWGFLDEFIKLKPKITKNITIYILTSSIDPADIERAKHYTEVSDFLIKPIKLEDLVVKLNAGVPERE